MKILVLHTRQQWSFLTTAKKRNGKNENKIKHRKKTTTWHCKLNNMFKQLKEKTKTKCLMVIICKDCINSVRAFVSVLTNSSSMVNGSLATCIKSQKFVRNGFSATFIRFFVLVEHETCLCLLIRKLVEKHCWAT